MEYIYAAMLLHKAKKEINDANLEAVLKAAGVTVDHAQVKAVVAQIKGINIDEAIKNASVAAVAAPVAAAGGEKKEEKKETKEDAKKKESEAAAGLGALFG